MDRSVTVKDHSGSYALRVPTARGKFPLLATMPNDTAPDLDVLFEYELTRRLDGCAALPSVRAGGRGGWQGSAVVVRLRRRWAGGRARPRGARRGGRHGSGR